MLHDLEACTHEFGTILHMGIILNNDWVNERIFSLFVNLIDLSLMLFLLSWFFIHHTSPWIHYILRKKFFIFRRMAAPIQFFPHFLRHLELIPWVFSLLQLILILLVFREATFGDHRSLKSDSLWWKILLMDDSQRTIKLTPLILAYFVVPLSWMGDRSIDIIMKHAAVVGHVRISGFIFWDTDQIIGTFILIKNRYLVCSR